MPYLTPDSAPAGTICRTLVIPDDPFWLSIVTGALSELMHSYRFEQFGTATPEETAERFSQMFDEFVASECQMNAAGEIRLFAFTAVPAGWLRCEAQSLLRADYPDLFTAIGTTFGSADGTHFALPDLRARSAVGYAEGATEYALGYMAGEEKHALIASENGQHSHVQFGFASGTTTPAQNIAGARTGSNTAVNSTGQSGSGEPHENRSPYTVLVYAIYTG